ncbi:uncharacterized protein LOC121359878 [Pyrgilauda ruficollis]|uniref:uncharacterized protein LOC121359878 n=1 Tax=Pyrgilauda ruficollis TaxID=221976 RepID=UPI001B869C79|nr:uncharacterized protein LOC121359878 [Pyrgilauda ruficollis]
MPELSPAPALHFAAVDPEPKPTRELWPGAAPLPRILHARRLAVSPRPWQLPVFSTCPESSSVPGQGGLWAPDGFAGGGKGAGGLPGPAAVAPSRPQAPNNPSLAIKGRVFFFPRLRQRRVPGRALQPLLRRDLSKFSHPELPPQPVSPGSSIPGKPTAAAAECLIKYQEARQAGERDRAASSTQTAGQLCHLPHIPRVPGGAQSHVVEEPTHTAGPSSSPGQLEGKTELVECTKG